MIWFDWFYGISTLVCYLMWNPLWTYILNLYDLVLWHINQWRLFNVKSSLYIYIKYVWFCLVGFYGISTIVGYSMSKPLYTYTSNMYDFVWLGFMAYQPLSVIQCQILFIHIHQICMILFGWVLWHINHCRLFNTKSSLYILHMICKCIVCR